MDMLICPCRVLSCVDWRRTVPEFGRAGEGVYTMLLCCEGLYHASVGSAITRRCGTGRGRQ
jgi:hypothetical protein